MKVPDMTPILHAPDQLHNSVITKPPQNRAGSFIHKWIQDALKNPENHMLSRLNTQNLKQTYFKDFSKIQL